MYWILRLFIRKSLCELAEDGNARAIRILLKAGVDVDAPCSKWSDAQTPLYTASLGSQLDIAKLLVAGGAHANAIGYPSIRATPLHGCARYGGNPRSLEIADLLIANGADVNAKDHDGSTPLHFATTNPKLASLLLASGAHVNAKNNGASTPLHNAVARCGSHGPDVARGVIELLCAAGADLNATDDRGVTPLHWAAYWDCLWAAVYLVELGASIDDETQSPIKMDMQDIDGLWLELPPGLTPLGIAIERHSSAVQEYLRSKQITSEKRAQIGTPRPNDSPEYKLGRASR